MSYLPDLRASLVKAAARQNASAVRAKSRRRVTVGGLATALATAVAIAVAALALTVLPHGRHGSTAQGGSAPSPKKVAKRLLDQLALPAGAVETGLVPGIPADLWSPTDPGESLPAGVDIHRVWRLPESPDRVYRFIQAHLPAGSHLGVSSESTLATDGGPERILSVTASITYTSSPNAATWRELTINLEPLRRGGSALRADARAGRMNPRPSSERIPDTVDRVQITGTTHSRGYQPQQQSSTITSPLRVRYLVGLFNSLPRSQPGMPGCVNRTDSRVRFLFERGGSPTPLAVAIMGGCTTVQLTIAGHPQPDLTFGFPTGGAQAFALGRTLRSVVPGPAERQRRQSVSQSGVSSSAHRGTPTSR